MSTVRKRIAAFVLAAALSGCASAPPGPAVPGPQAAALFAAFNGSWTLVPEESRSPEPGATGGGRRRPGGDDTGFLPPRGGGRAGRGGGRAVPPPDGPGGGGGRGIPGRGGDVGRPIPTDGPGTLGGPGEGLAILTVLPALELVVTDSTLAVTPRAAEPDSTGASPPRVWPRPDGYELRLDGEEVMIARIKASARWNGRVIEVERKLDDGPEVKELWSVDEAAGRLVVTREIDVPGRPKIEQRQVYRRVGA
jgi:hypothetical protein